MTRRFSSVLRFEELIAPVKLSEFYERYWEREVLHLPAVDAKKFSDLLTVADLDSYLSRSDLRSPALRLIKSGTQIPVESYTTTFSLGGQQSRDLIRTDRVLAHYRSGATILIQLAHWSLPTLQPFAAQLRKFFSFNVELNVYLTPPNAQGFSAHFDTHSVFILQLAGNKSWQLHGTRPVQPLLEDRFDETTEKPGAVEAEIELTPGSFLYVPRGKFHSAKANSQPSLHVTVGLFPPTWLDIFQQRLVQMKTDGRFRRAPTPTETSTLADLVGAFGRDFSFDAVRSVISSNNLSVEGQPSLGRLIDAIGVESLSLRTTLRVRHEAGVALVNHNEKLSVRGIGAEVTLPKRAGQFVSEILRMQNDFRLEEIEAGLDGHSALVVARALLKEGVLALSGPEAA